MSKFATNNGHSPFYRRIGYLLVLLSALVMWLVITVGFGVALVYSNRAQALEADYADPWCAAQGGVAEKALADRTRVDCLLPGFAVEVDYAHKWAEAMGQALHYGRMTDRMPGVMLILKKPADARYVRRLNADAEHWGLPLFVWTVKAYAPGQE